MIQSKQVGGLLKNNPNTTGAMVNYMRKPINTNTQAVAPAPTTGEKIHNTLSDLGTGVATWGTSFRRPTPEELNLGRSGWAGRAKLLSGAATQGMVNTMIGAGLSKLAAPAVAPAIKRTAVGTADVADSTSELRKRLMQDGGVMAADSTNNARLKGLMGVPGAVKSFMLNKRIPGTIGGVLDTQLSTVSPDRKLPEATDPNVKAVGEFNKTLSQPEMDALINTTANPFGKQGWLKNVVFNPKVAITGEKMYKAGKAARGLYNLNKDGYKF